MEKQTTENLLLQIEELQKRLAETDQLIAAIKAGEVDAFAITKNNKLEVYTLQSGDYAYRMLVENFSEGALNLSENGLIVYTNTSFHKTLKLPYEKVIAQNIFQFIHPDSIETFKELLKNGFAGKSEGEINLITGKKSCPVYVSLTSLYPNLPTVGVLVSDLTERKKALLDLKAKANLQNIFKHAPAAIAVFDGPDHRYIMANQVYQKQYNRKEKDFLGKTFREVFPELDGTGPFELCDDVYRTGETFKSSEYAAMINWENSGIPTQRYFNFSLEPLRNEADEIYGLMAMTFDITEQVKLRKQIEETDKRQAFLLKLSDALRPLRNAEKIEEAATKIACDFMDADRCYYNTLEEGNAIVLRDAFRGELTSLAAVYPVADFALLIAAINNGLPFVVDDVTASDIVEEGLKQMCLGVQVNSMINVPIINNGKAVGVFALAQSKPRKWTEAEVKLCVETAERIGTAVERAKAEESLRLSEEKYRSLITSIDQGYAICELIRNDEGKGIDIIMLDVNPTYEQQTGVSKEMVVGKPLLQVFPTVNKSLALYAALVDNQRPVEFEDYFEGTDRWFAIKAYHFEKDKFVVLFNDITEHKQAEKRLRESESRFRTIADSSSVLIWMLDHNGVSTYYNKSFLHFIGVLKQEDIAGWEKIVHPDDFQYRMDSQDIAMVQRSSYSMEFRLLRHDGLWRWVLVQGNPHTSSNNEFLGFLVSAVDISERKQAEYELMEAKTSAENAAKAKQQFLSTMSHEIRTPLNSIIGFTNVLFKTDLGEKQKEFVEAIKTSGKSLNALINDILDLAKVDANKMTFEKRPFVICESLDSIVQSFSLKIKEKNLELIKEYDSNIPFMLLGDSVRLNQILINLISNAIKFTYKGKIVLGVKLLSENEENVTIEFALTDTGIGIAANKMNLIFNLFEQAETSTANTYGGTGLGLAIVKQLVEAQGGSISVESKIGEGSTFSFILPFSKTDIQPQEDTEIVKLDSEIKNLRVLVAEDVALNQMLIKIILGEFGFEYDIVDNGKLVTEKLASASLNNKLYDIILMDLHMPEMNGYEAAEYIRKTMKSQIPIIALTADVTSADISKCKEFGMDSYISKPINENLLYSRIVELVKRKNFK